jgi:hypothetical protein
MVVVNGRHRAIGRPCGRGHQPANAALRARRLTTKHETHPHTLRGSRSDIRQCCRLTCHGAEKVAQASVRQSPAPAASRHRCRRRPARRSPSTSDLWSSTAIAFTPCWLSGSRRFAMSSEFHQTRTLRSFGIPKGGTSTSHCRSFRRSAAGRTACIWICTPTTRGRRCNGCSSWERPSIPAPLSRARIHPPRGPRG